MEFGRDTAHCEDESRISVAAVVAETLVCGTFLATDVTHFTEGKD